MKTKLIKTFTTLCFLLVACQQNQEPTLISEVTPLSETAIPKSTSTTIYTPTIPPSIIELEGAILPAGFSLIKFAEVYRPTSFTFDLEGRLYVTSPDGNVYVFTDSNQDGHEDEKSLFAEGFKLPLGITFNQNTGDFYVSYQGGIMVLSDTDKDGRADSQKVLVNDLPSSGLHSNDNLKFGPDGWLYMGQGSTCNACEERDPRNGTILRFNFETGESEIYATGMRNPYDLAFHPLTGELFATDNGRDDLGLGTPQEELNLIIQNRDYGFPNCWDNQDTPECANTIPAVAFFESHSSANGLDFNSKNNFPQEYQNNAFVSILGSWLKQDVQTGITRVILKEKDGGYDTEISWLVKFPEGVMPLPLLFDSEGALYVGDYINGVIYKITYGIP